MDESESTVMTSGEPESVESNETVMTGDIDEAQESDMSELIEAGEFDKVAELLELDEDSKDMVDNLTKIANVGSNEQRVWACGMLNWTKDMSKYIKGL